MSDIFDAIAWPRVVIYVVLGTFGLGTLVTYLKKRWEIRDGFSRKMNHFGISILSVPFISLLDSDHFIPSAVIASIAVILISLWSCLSKHPTLANITAGCLRQSDAPYAKAYYLFPLISGQIAFYSCLALVNPAFAKAAFLSMGIGDGLAEPVGIAFGRHKFKTYDLVRRKCVHKSLEGSATVFLGAFLAASLILSQTPFGADPFRLMGLCLLYGAIIALVEAISPRGCDNLLIISAGSAVLHLMFT